MALINCPNCGKKVSDRAAKCPHCGVDIKTLKVTVSESSEKEKKPDKITSAVIQEEAKHKEIISTSTTETKGASMSTEEPESNQGEVNKEEVEEEKVIPKKKNSLRWILFALIFIGLGTVGYLFFNHHQKMREMDALRLQQTQDSIAEGDDTIQTDMVLEGKIGGKYPIHMTLNGDRTGGSYYYDKYGPDNCLTLYVTDYDATTGLLKMEERNDKGEVTGRFEGRLTAKSYVGTLTLTNGKEFTFDLTSNVITVH